MSDTVRRHSIDVPHIFKEGYGVFVDPYYDDETGTISDIEVAVVHIAPDTVILPQLHNAQPTLRDEIQVVPCVEVEHPTDPGAPKLFVPVDNFKELPDLSVDDTHDLRCRWFPTKDEAEAHASSVLDRWKNPQPWESFVAI